MEDGKGGRNSGNSARRRGERYLPAPFTHTPLYPSSLNAAKVSFDREGAIGSHKAQRVNVRVAVRISA